VEASIIELTFPGKEHTMTDRADYYIEKVRYNKDHTRIIWVSIRQDNNSKLGGAYNMVRKKIVSLMHAGKLFMTIYRNPEGKYRKGQKIAMIRVKGTEYIRTDQEEMEKDQLENLPEF
jgi:Protein of unknown function (DUF3892)